MAKVENRKRAGKRDGKERSERICEKKEVRTDEKETRRAFMAHALVWRREGLLWPHVDLTMIRERALVAIELAVGWGMPHLSTLVSEYFMVIPLVFTRPQGLIGRLFDFSSLLYDSGKTPDFDPPGRCLFLSASTCIWLTFDYIQISMVEGVGTRAFRARSATVPYVLDRSDLLSHQKVMLERLMPFDPIQRRLMFLNKHPRELVQVVLPSSLTTDVAVHRTPLPEIVQRTVADDHYPFPCRTPNSCVVLVEERGGFFVRYDGESCKWNWRAVKRADTGNQWGERFLVDAPYCPVLDALVLFDGRTLAIVHATQLKIMQKVPVPLTGTWHPTTFQWGMCKTVAYDTATSVVSTRLRLVYNPVARSSPQCIVVEAICAWPRKDSSHKAISKTMTQVDRHNLEATCDIWRPSFVQLNQIASPTNHNIKWSRCSASVNGFWCMESGHTYLHADSQCIYSLHSDSQELGALPLSSLDDQVRVSVSRDGHSWSLPSALFEYTDLEACVYQASN